MRITFFTLYFISFTIFSFSQDVYIPDSGFKNYLLNNNAINTNYDSEIQYTEAANYSDSIICVGLGITDLTGIEAFVNLKFLSCVNNSISSIDLSQNVMLEDLICALNYISTLDLSQNLALRNLRCSYNPISYLDLSGNTNLQYLYCEDTNLSSIDLSNNNELTELSLYDNYLTELDLTNSPVLRILRCNGNDINVLNVSDCTELEKIVAFGNNLTALDLSDNVNLKELNCFANQLPNLDLTNNVDLVYLDCSINQLTSLDLSNNTNLERIDCFDNLLSELNVSNGFNENLTRFWASLNDLTCIQIDNPDYSNTNWNGYFFEFDEGVQFDTNCSLNLRDVVYSSINIYPNPVMEKLNIELEKDYSFELFSLHGKLVEKGNFHIGNNEFNVENLPDGFYLIQLTDSERGKITLKFKVI